MRDLAAIAAEFGDDPEPTPRIFTHSGTVWRWQAEKDGTAAWFFLVIDGDTAQAIRAVAGPRRGFGSVKVKAQVGRSAFATSIFPSKEMGGFLLPLKASVRKAEKLDDGSPVTARIELA